MHATTPRCAASSLRPAADANTIVRSTSVKFTGRTTGALQRSTQPADRLTGQQLQALVLVEDFGDGDGSHGVHDDLPLSPELGPSVSRAVAKVPTGRSRESTDADVDLWRPSIPGANGPGDTDREGGLELVGVLGEQRPRPGGCRRCG